MIYDFYCPAAESSDVKYLKGVGPARAAQLERLDVRNAADLLCLYPRDYIDFSGGGPFSAAADGDLSRIKATVIGEPFRQHTQNRSVTLYRVGLRDDSGVSGTAVFFNSVYSARGLEPGKKYCFRGKFQRFAGRNEIISPEYMPAEESGGPMVRPVYPQTKGLTSAAISKIMRGAAARFLPDIEDPVPKDVLDELGLCDLRTALAQIHFPDAMDEVREARKRLIFGELLMFVMTTRRFRAAAKSSDAYPVPQCGIPEFYRALPFELTEGQKRAVAEASADMARRSPMSRMLQGDVGSGKTAVCAALLYRTARAGCQSAFMAPTELLAGQHYRTLVNLLGGLGISVGLLTGSTPAAARRELLGDLASGRLQVIVGTHALFSDDVAYHRLALVVTDEQHRFGVRQRAQLAAKGESPHMYVMSATPIPRSLALILYGDLDMSVLDTVPGGRMEIKTYIYRDPDRTRLFGFIKKELDAGRQAYIVCPSIEEGESGRPAAVEYYKNYITRGFSGYTSAVLHGRLPAQEKKDIMERFAAGKIQLLVSTTVIEVGIDVANATVMVIESAESFGLAQLHQLRGRVGRGRFQSYCVLVSQSPAKAAYERLAILRAGSNGFEIAEKDLQLRGPGDFLGERQSGLPVFRLSGGLSEPSLIAAAQNVAARFEKDCPPAILRVLDGISGKITAGYIS